jgi:secretion/DNA translocation related CpaE-like protein
MHPRPLAVTADPDVLDDLLRLAATAGTELDVAPDAAGARRAWAAAPLVLVGHDAAPGCARARLPRRADVVLIGDGLDDAGVWELAVRLGAEHVVFLPDAEPWLTGALADAAEGALREAPLVAVVGGRGGAGATSLACALAVTAARSGRNALLVDGDPLGGGIDLCFGGERDPGLRWPDLGGTRGRLPSAALAEALPRMQDLAVLSWDRGTAPAAEPDAVRAVLQAGRRSSALVVVDLPRHVDDAVRAVLEQATLVLLLVPAEVRAAASAARVAATVGLVCRDLRLVVRAPGPSGLDPGQLARALGLPLAGVVRPEPGLDRALERGEAPGSRGRGPLRDLCAGLLAELLPPLRSAA